MLHGEFVVADRAKTGAVKTAETQVGTVTQVTSSSVTVRSADAFEQTWKVTPSTRVMLAGTPKPDTATGTVTTRPRVAPGTVAQVKKGLVVRLIGLKTGTDVTATWIGSEVERRGAADGPTRHDDRSGAFVRNGEHQAGTVTSVSASSISVKGEDGTVRTWAVAKDTHVLASRHDQIKVTDLKAGDHVLIMGLKQFGKDTAVRIVRRR